MTPEPSLERRALRAFRIAAVGLLVLVTFEWGTRIHVLTLAALPAEHPYRLHASALLVAIVVGWFATFGLAFWKNTGRIEGAVPPRRALLLLALQFPVAWGGSLELLILLAIEAPLLLSGRALGGFLALVGLVPFGTALWELIQTGLPSDASDFPGLSPLAAWALGWMVQLAWLGLGAAAGWLAARAVRSWRELLQANAEVRAGRALLAENARVAERLALSRELHDVLGHHLAALRQHLELARRRSDGEAAAAVARAGELVRRLLARLRSAVAALRRPASLDLGLALRTLAEAAPDLESEVVVADALQLTPLAGAALFRCACEGVAAAVQAGGRRRLRILLGAESGGHVLRVEIAPARARGPGEEALRGLRALLAPLGGVLEAGPFAGGFRLLVVVPAAAAER